MSLGRECWGERVSIANNSSSSVKAVISAHSTVAEIFGHNLTKQTLQLLNHFIVLRSCNGLSHPACIQVSAYAPIRSISTKSLKIFLSDIVT